MKVKSCSLQAPSIVVVPLLVLLFACSANRSAFQQQAVSVNSESSSLEKVLQSKQPSLSIEAYPRQGFAPLRVIFNAMLDGVSQKDPNYSCLYEEWDFGDGAVSGEKSDCTHRAENSPIDTQFLAEHVFNTSGSYTIQFRLGNNQIVSRRISVKVYDRN